MIHGGQEGERVKLARPAFHREKVLGGELISRWPLGATEGVIVRRELFYGQSPSLWVRPDHPEGYGETRLRPCDLERLDSAREQCAKTVEAA